MAMADNMFLGEDPRTKGFVPSPSPAPSSDMDIMGLLDQLRTDQERQAELSRQMAEAGKPNIKGRLGGLGAVILLSLLGGKAGRAGMGEAMQNFNQGFTSGENEARALRMAPIQSELAGMKGQQDLRKDIMGWMMKPAFEEKYKSMYREPKANDQTTEERNYNAALRTGFKGSFQEWLDRNKKDSPDRMPSSDQVIAQILSKQAQGQKLNPYEEAVLKQYANMKAYSQMYLPYSMGLVPGLPQITPGPGPGGLGTNPVFK